MKFSVFQLSRKGGRVRNEDRMGYCYTSAASIFLLADGMGGHPEGDVAAHMALQVVAALFQQQAKPELPDVRDFMRRALMAAHRQILRYAADNAREDTPRTTLVAAVVQGGQAYWMHCGDSRFYFVRNEALLARTRDHSHLERRHEADPSGQVLPAVHRNVLYTCLGSPRQPVIEVNGPVHLLQGDKLMLCSDGLWASLTDEEIVRQLGRHTVSAAATDLVDQALRNGGVHCDNVTVVAMEWESPNAFESPGAGVVTELLDEGAFASTVQADWVDAELDDFDDAAIERSIAEIKAAIQRTAARKL